jgi:predicted membrane channel-forming protein YqfA (hemolysin III family)
MATASARSAAKTRPPGRKQGRRPHRPHQREADGSEQGQTQDIGDRVRTFLGEYRIITPALAALFGFQLTAAFQDSYMQLAAVDRAINFAGVACTATAILCLLVPASYHRFTSKLEETEDFLAFARLSISLAFVFIPLGITMALYLQAVRTFQSHAVAAAVAVVALGAFAAVWWVLPRHRAHEQGLHPSQDERL